MQSPGPLRIGTRGSALAVAQTRQFADRLRAGGVAVEIEIIATRGDVRQGPVATLGGDGVFVRELEQALLEGRIDAAVHSLKDLPTAETPGLDVACVPERAIPFDVLVSRTAASLADMPAGAVVGTSSVRRVAQVRRLRPDLAVHPLRGNVDTRLRRLDAGDFDAIVLAGAGLERLGLAGRVTQVLRPDDFWPAISQGALGVQIRATDDHARSLVGALDHPASHAAVRAERGCLAVLAGGCLAPVGGWASLDADGRLALSACVLEEAAGGVTRLVAADETACADEASAAAAAEPLGRRVASDLLARGAAAMLERMRFAGPGATPSA